MQALYKKRLRTLCDLMKTVPPNRFDIGHWADDNFCGKPNEATHDSPTCRTAACVGGWACTVPAFKKAGLTLIEDCGILIPTFRGNEEMTALEEFFGLEDVPLPDYIDNKDYCIHSVADYIFHGSNKNSVKDAVRRIENVLKMIDLQEQLETIR